MTSNKLELVPQPHGGALSRSGRPQGAKNKSLKAIRDALYIEETGEDGKTAISGVIPALISKAKDGDMRAIELCMSYGIGKPTEKLEVTGAEGGPVLLSPVLASISDEKLQAELKRLQEDMED